MWRDVHNCKVGTGYSKLETHFGCVKTCDEKLPTEVLKAASRPLFYKHISVGENRTTQHNTELQSACGIVQESLAPQGAQVSAT